MRQTIILLAIILSLTFVASAQTEADLKQYFEGRHVTLKIDVPATKDGVNVYPERAQPLDYSEYATRLKRSGTSIRRGESVMITKIKVKGKHVEFQLGGGGYGTFGDETDASVNVPSAPKTRREKNLEAELKRETDPARRKRIKEDLGDLRREREREDRINQSIAAEAEETRRARIEQKALQGGGRFNIHFSLLDAGVLTPRAISDALRKYIDFDADEDNDDVALRPVAYDEGAARQNTPGVISVGPRTTFLQAGLSTREVLRLLGQPAMVRERNEDGATVQVYEFPRGDGRVLFAEFANDVLVRSRTVTGAAVARGGAVE
jgi:hypothetical protein